MAYTNYAVIAGVEKPLSQAFKPVYIFVGAGIFNIGFLCGMVINKAIGAFIKPAYQPYNKNGRKVGNNEPWFKCPVFFSEKYQGAPTSRPFFGPANHFQVWMWLKRIVKTRLM